MKIPFHELAARAAAHDPATCTREVCRRCDGPHIPTPPARIDHTPRGHVDRSTSPFDPLPPPLTAAAPTMPAKLAHHMLTLAAAITEHGPERWQRLCDWEARTIGVSLVHMEPPEDDTPEAIQQRRDSIPTDTLRDRDDRQRAGRYAEEARTEALRLLTILEHGSEHAVRTSVQRLRFLIAVAELRHPRQLKSREIAAAQAAADGWCRSCFRVGVFEPVGLRATGEPYYRDLCRWCGQNKGTQDQPTVDMVRVHHRLPTRRAS